ncbi:hypothetical protein BKA82DRAFT_832160 [Pisolithus tinctorius]|uniref:Uncharacterized protein n=1 Tax=Pisolithus tinctorius Marx 270 TaxID=870435 RepID=A0A0C3PR76_PISTI|nr:hypothetical protein BKA82DRAFT_832160 [Pisolithus tinctorius]KIO11084.1 hypothetical protein M404DRAFT_832160 [Pisolithus tinctorius Marx 270]
MFMTSAYDHDFRVFGSFTTHTSVLVAIIMFFIHIYRQYTLSKIITSRIVSLVSYMLVLVFQLVVRHYHPRSPLIGDWSSPTPLHVISRE